MSRYPCRHCIIIKSCTKRCEKILGDIQFKNEICPDCGTKIKHTCKTCSRVTYCRYCGNCNRVFYDVYNPTSNSNCTYRTLVINEGYCWNHDDECKIEKSWPNEGVKKWKMILSKCKNVLKK